MSDVRAIDAIVMGGSAGAIEALNAILPALPADYPVPIAIVLHVLPSKPSLLTAVLGPRCAMNIKEAEDKEPLKASTIYVAAPNYHLLVERQRWFSLSFDAAVHFSRPSIDVLFESAADAYGANLAGVLLSGANDDGARGLQAISDRGGIAVVQAPQTSAVDTMPLAALEACPRAHVLPLTDIAPFLIQAAAAREEGAPFTSNRSQA